MPHVNIPKLILETYNFWNMDFTFYTEFPIDNDLRVYSFGCHFGHTDVRFKVNIFELLKNLE